MKIVLLLQANCISVFTNTWARSVLFYITTWIPASRRGRFAASFMAAIPIPGGILHVMDRLLGLQVWQ